MLKIPSTPPPITAGSQLNLPVALSAKLNLPMGQVMKVDIVQLQPTAQPGLSNVTLTLQGQTLSAQTDLNLRPGQSLLVQAQMSNTGQIILKIQPQIPPVQLETLRQALPHQVNLTQAIAQLVQMQPQLPAPVSQPLQQLLSQLRLSTQNLSNSQFAQAVQQGSANLEAQLAGGQSHPNLNLKAVLMRLSQGLQQWQATAAPSKQSLIGQLLKGVEGAINQVKVQQIQWLAEDYQWISQHLLALDQRDYLARLFFKNLSHDDDTQHWQVVLELSGTAEDLADIQHYLQLDWFAPAKLTLGIYSDDSTWHDQFIVEVDKLRNVLKLQGFDLARVYRLTSAPDPLKLRQDFQLIDIRI
jgi:hypothetical protein